MSVGPLGLKKQVTLKILTNGGAIGSVKTNARYLNWIGSSDEEDEIELHYYRCPPRLWLATHGS